MDPTTRLAGDGAAYAIALAVWAKYVPSLAATFTVIWLACQVYGFVQNQFYLYRKRKTQRRRKSDAR